MPPVLQQCGSQLSSACSYELVPWMMNMTSEAQLMQCATAQRGNLAPMCQVCMPPLTACMYCAPWKMVWVIAFVACAVCALPAAR